MNESILFLDQFDRLCQQFAAAIQSSELQIYTILAVVVATILVFPPKDDPDQI